MEITCNIYSRKCCCIMFYLVFLCFVSNTICSIILARWGIGKKSIFAFLEASVRKNRVRDCSSIQTEELSGEMFCVIDFYVIGMVEMYAGTFEDGEIVKGHHISDFGEFHGEFDNYLYDGRGRYIYEFGAVFEGEWKEGLIEGYGEYLYENGDRYEGNWKESAFSGYGVYERTDNARYEGEWEDGIMHGQGCWTTEDGKKYEGEFVYGEYIQEKEERKMFRDLINEAFNEEESEFDDDIITNMVNIDDNSKKNITIFPEMRVIVDDDDEEEEEEENTTSTDRYGEDF